MAESYARAKRKSSRTKGCELQPVTKSGSTMAEHVNSVKRPRGRNVSRVLASAGTRFGLWETRGEVYTKGRYRRVKVACTGCGREKEIDYNNLYTGKSTACKPCGSWIGHGRKTPQWLRDRMQAALQRCRNPRNAGWSDYGGRGIEFRFNLIEEAARWIVDNIPHWDNRDLYLDRLNNDGHYEPGNLGMVSHHESTMNRRNTKLPVEWVYRAEEWPYVECVVRKKLYSGKTREDILADAHEAVRRKRKRWRVIAARLASMTS